MLKFLSILLFFISEKFEWNFACAKKNENGELSLQILNILRKKLSNLNTYSFQ